MEGNSIPKMTREDVMNCMNESWKDINVDQPLAFKTNWLTKKMDGSEDYLVSHRIRSLVDDDFEKLRDELLKTIPPKSVKKLVKKITPPEGVKRKSQEGDDIEGDNCDEGRELYDCDGSETEEDSSSSEYEDEENDEENEDEEQIVIDPSDEDETNEEGQSEMFKIVQEYQALLDNHRRKMSTKEALPLLPFSNRIQLQICSARFKLRKELLKHYILSRKIRKNY